MNGQPPVIANVLPPVSPEADRKSGAMRQFLAIVLNLCLALFLVDAVASLADDSLILFGGLHPLTTIRTLTSILASIMALGIYGLIGLTPLVPKRCSCPSRFTIWW